MEQQNYTTDEICQLEGIVKEDLETATVSFASVHIGPDGRIVIDEIVLLLSDGRMVSPAPVDSPIGTAVDLRLEVYDDHLPGGHGWREATISEDYPEESADLRHVWHPEPDTLEEARY